MVAADDLVAEETASRKRQHAVPAAVFQGRWRAILTSIDHDGRVANLPRQELALELDVTRDSIPGVRRVVGTPRPPSCPIPGYRRHERLLLPPRAIVCNGERTGTPGAKAVRAESPQGQ